MPRHADVDLFERQRAVVKTDALAKRMRTQRLDVPIDLDKLFVLIFQRDGLRATQAYQRNQHACRQEDPLPSTHRCSPCARRSAQACHEDETVPQAVSTRTFLQRDERRTSITQICRYAAKLPWPSWSNHVVFNCVERAENVAERYDDLRPGVRLIRHVWEE